MFILTFDWISTRYCLIAPRQSHSLGSSLCGSLARDTSWADRHIHSCLCTPGTRSDGTRRICTEWRCPCLWCWSYQWCCCRLVDSLAWKPSRLFKALENIVWGVANQKRFCRIFTVDAKIPATILTVVHVVVQLLCHFASLHLYMCVCVCLVRLQV